jgi:lysozyme
MAKPFPQLTPQGMQALKRAEGDIPYVYDDAVFPTVMWKPGSHVRGNLTAGVGHLLNPAEIKQWGGKKIPQYVRDEWLDDDTDKSELNVHKNVKVSLTPHQRDALIMFDFNVGHGAFNKSTLLKKLNAGKYSEVPGELMKWTKTTIDGRKVTSKGLIKRRSEEIALWNGSVVTAVTTNELEPYGTQIAEPEAPKTVTLDGISTGAGIISTIFGSITDGPLAYAVAGIAVVAFGIAAYLYLTKRLFPR